MRRRLALGSAALLGAGVLVAAPAEAAEGVIPVSSFTNLAASSTCAPGQTLKLKLDAPISEPGTAGEWIVDCHVELDLTGQNLRVRNIIINPGKKLTITDESAGGTLTADASGVSGVAGIQNTDADLVISGGTVTATGGDGAAGIGGGAGGDGDDVVGPDTGNGNAAGNGGTTVISGGIVHATGNGGGAGIGGGSGGDGGDAWGDHSGNGGTAGNGHITTITGGVVHATGNGGSAGIGGGSGGDGGNDVDGVASGNGGTAGNGGTITITGGIVHATGNDGGAGIGGGSAGQDGTRASFTGNTSGRGGGGGSGGSTAIGGDAKVTSRGGVGGAGIGGGYRGLAGDTTLSDHAEVAADGGEYVDGAVLRGGAGIGSGGDSSSSAATTTIKDDADATATGADGAAGIGGGADADGHDTTISGNAKVIAKGGDGAAGIGGGDYGGDAASTTISGDATVTATGGASGAGIGGGYNGDGGETTIEGGVVTAIPDAGVGTSANAIGGGELKTDTAKLTVTGGTLVLPSGIQQVPAASAVDSPLFAIGSGGIVTGGATTSAELSGDGVLVNQGALTLPTDKVGNTLVSGHHYSVVFDLNHTGVGTAPDPVTVYAPTFTQGDRDFPTDPTRPGYTFTGWNTAPDGTGQPITATSTLPGVSADGNPVEITAYATWTADTPAPPPAIWVSAPTLANTTSSTRGTTHPQVGDQLTVTAPAAGIAYTWQRHHSDTDTWTDLGTSTTYTLTPGDIDSRVRVHAVATAVPYTGTATSTPTGPIQPAPLPDPRLAITGEPRIDQTLTATATLPDTPGLDTRWAWHARTPGTDTWIPIEAATTPTLPLSAEHVGLELQVTLTQTAPGHQTRTDTATTSAPVANHPALPTTDRPTLSAPRKAPRVGKTVTLTAPRPDVPGATQTYQWQRTRDTATTDGPRWVDIPGADQSTYTPKPGDLKRRLRVVVTTTAPDHQVDVSTTRPSKGVKKGLLPKPDTAITIRGKQRAGKTLRLVKVAPYRAQLPNDAKIRFAWYANGQPIPGATRPRLTIRPALANTKLHATITTTAPGHRKRTITIR